MLRVALVQCRAGLDKAANIANALRLVTQAAEDNAKLVVLPECFNSPYGTQYFADYAESVPEGDTCKALSECAKQNGVYLVGGSIPERSNEGKLYNTLTAYSPLGHLLATHRKVHLFDIDVPGGIKFQESDVLTAGDRLSMIQIDEWRIGLGICYDVRFAGMACAYRAAGCDMLVYPGAFNMTTGPLHWELLARARSNDNQLYTIMCSPARDPNATYTAYGHSLVVDPWGKVIGETGHEEDVVHATLDKAEVDKVRQAIPISKQMRPGVYKT